MRAQLARLRAEQADGASLVGWKIGFNTPAIQQHFGLADPVVGYLTDTGVSGDGATISLAGWTNPVVEVEVAVRVGDHRGTVAGLAPALELVDLDLPFDDLEPILAGNIFQRGVVFGPEVTDLDPWSIRVAATKNTDPPIEGQIAEDPADTVRFVHSYLASHGTELQTGHRIIAGSMVVPISVQPGDRVAVDFGPLGHLAVDFVA
jgi:2-keto-4-pentenoate hydratase